jgi:hypothetical protein
LSLFGESQPVRSRVDGATVRQDFTQTIKAKGGNGDAQAASTEKMTEVIFGCGTKELYEGTKSRKGDRSTLPQDAQTAYIVGETVSTHDLKATEIKGNQQQRNEQIEATVEESSHKVKGFFPWNW